MERSVRRLIILGSTGSIGSQALDVVEHLSALHARGEWSCRYEVVGLASGRRAPLLFEQAGRLGVRDLALADADVACEYGTARLRRGPSAAEELVREVEADLVVAAIVGIAGLPATLAAVELGRDVALANKETLVAAGALIVPAAQRSGARLLPVDSEHSAVWQCVQGVLGEGRGAREGRVSAPPYPPRTSPLSSVSRIILTASGGPFLALPLEQVYHATPGQALRHPVWDMGPKVTVDSASLTNKALEVIEAHWLFGLPPERIEVLIHPQSIVHSLVEFADGSTIAQAGSPDMRTPIQYALTYPRRPPGCAPALDWRAARTLEFFPPDTERFPALALAYEVIRRGGTAGAVFNAANEEAVRAFLGTGPAPFPFGRITELVAEAFERLGPSPLACVSDVMAADAEARRYVRSRLAR